MTSQTRSSTRPRAARTSPTEGRASRGRGPCRREVGVAQLSGRGGVIDDEAELDQVRRVPVLRAEVERRVVRDRELRVVRERGAGRPCVVLTLAKGRDVEVAARIAGREGGDVCVLFGGCSVV